MKKKKFKHFSNIFRFEFSRDTIYPAAEVRQCRWNLWQKTLLQTRSSLNQIGGAWDQGKSKDLDTTWPALPLYILQRLANFGKMTHGFESYRQTKNVKNKHTHKCSSELMGNQSWAWPTKKWGPALVRQK